MGVAVIRSSRLAACTLPALVLVACGAKEAVALTGQAASVHGTWTCTAKDKGPTGIVSDLVGTITYFSDGKWNSTHVEKGKVQGRNLEATYTSRGVWEIRDGKLWENAKFAAATSLKSDGKVIDHGQLNQHLANSGSNNPLLGESLSTIDELSADKLVTTDDKKLTATCKRPKA